MTGLSLKPGVTLMALKPQILLGLQALLPVFQAAGVELVVTSVCDSMHHPGSLHPYGYAVDIRSSTKFGKNPEVDLSLLHSGSAVLTGEFDFIIENLGTDNVHFHLEWDAKRLGKELTQT